MGLVTEAGDVKQVLREHFGRLAFDLDETTASVHLPGSRFCLLVNVSAGEYITVFEPFTETVGLPTGFSEAMLREQAAWRLGRVEFVADGALLAASHTLLWDWADDRSIPAVVIAMHTTAIDMAHLASAFAPPRCRAADDEAD